MANIQYHSDVRGYAINIKTHGVRFADGGDESQRERAYEETQRDFLQSAQEAAEACGYKLVTVCGRSGGWLAPMRGEREAEEDANARGLARFAAKVDKLMKEVPAMFSHYLAAMIHEDAEEARLEADREAVRELQRKREEIKTRDVETRAGCFPALPDGESVIFSEPGRVLDLKSGGGNWDVCFRAYSYLVTQANNRYTLRVRHGGGDESQPLSREAVRALYRLDSDARYFLLHALRDAKSTAERETASRVALEYKQAFADGRLKKRKRRGVNLVDVRIEPRAPGGDV